MNIGLERGVSGKQRGPGKGPRPTQVLEKTWEWVVRKEVPGMRSSLGWILACYTSAWKSTRSWLLTWGHMNMSVPRQHLMPKPSWS